MEGLPSNYKDNITVDNGVEIIWVNQKGQVIQQSDKSSSEKGGGAGDDGVVVGMPRVPKIRVTGGTPAGELLPASPGGTRRVSVAGTVSPAPQLIGPWFTNSPDASRPSSSGPPENEEDDADPEGHPCMALEPYAKEHHHTTRMGLLGKKRTPMETLLSWKGKQIASPLTIACRADKVMASEAVSTFGLIMGYMGDKKTKEPGMQILKSLQKRMLEGSEVFRDEVFCQVCKQTTSNPDANSDLRGWQLLLAILAVATPSQALAGCFKKHCEMGPVGSIPQTYAHYVLSALQKDPSLTPRTVAPCDVEIMALVQLSAVPVLVRLQDGNKVEVMADSWTSVTDLEKQIGAKLGLQDIAAFTVYEVSNTDGQRALRSKDRVLDIVAQWRTQACATGGVKKFQLFYQVRLHLRPNENDLAAVKLTYLQAVHDLCAGTYMVSTEDCVQLAAFQLQASKGDYNKSTCTVSTLVKQLPELVPPQILAQPESDEFRGPKDLAKKILAYYMMSLKGVSKKDARALFLGLMYEVPSFGRSYFEGEAMDHMVMIGIGANGVQFLDASDPDRAVLGEYDFSAIESFLCEAPDLAIMTLESHTGVRGFVKTKVKIESPQATQMKSLVHAYFVRYVLPKRAKEAEEKTGQVQPFTAGGG
eukprot:jgi/Undpi1/13736/HiC_scaffold_9.g03389.m1